MRKVKITMIIIFCFLLFTGFLAPLLLQQKEYSVIENRELAQKPDFNLKKFLKGKYQTQYESYLCDQIFLRDKWVSLSVMMQRVFGKKDINNVYLGKDGYLLEKIKESDFDTGQVTENIKYLSSFLNDMLNEYGKKHVSCIMIPSKTLAMSNKLPRFVKAPNQEKVIEGLREKLSDKDILIDLCDEMQKHQNEYIYYRTDHHWTTLGAYYGYTAWAGATGQASVHDEEHYQRKVIFNDFYGTTYNKVHVKVPADSVELFHIAGENKVLVEMDNDGVKYETMYFTDEALQGFNRYNIFFSKNTFKIEISKKTLTGRTLLLIKDSFANCFVPFLTEDYDHIIMIDYRYGKTPIGKIISEYEDITDVLVMFNTEKFMQNSKLSRLAYTQKESKTMKKFNVEDFLD